MTQSATPTDLIVERITHHPGCGLDDVVAFCPELTWNQIFLEVDRLSRAGRLRIMLTGRGRYRLALATDAELFGVPPLDPPERRPVLPHSRHDNPCERCRGLMVSEPDDDFQGWRCILCGERVDPVILAQRRNSESAGVGAMHGGR